MPRQPLEPRHTTPDSPRRQARILQGAHRERSIKAVRDHLKRERDAISPNDQTIKSEGK
jgi:hypothetical protein